MPEEQLKVGITGDASGLEAASRQAVSSLDKIDKGATATAKSLDKLPQVSQKISQAASQISANAAKMGGSVANGSNQAMQALNNLSRVAQDAPYGFIGISNNINPLLESFQRLKAETGTTGGALKALGSSLMGAGGLGLAVGVASSLLVVFGDKIFGAGKKAKEAGDEIKGAADLIGQSGADYREAFTEVNKLRDELDLAKKGFIDKTTVVNEYNHTIGETIGKVKTLDEVEQALADKGEAYIKFTLLKAAANKALEKSADEALKATVKQTELIKPLDTKQGLFKGLDKNMNAEDAARLKQGIGQAFEGVNRKVTEEVNKTKGESQRFEDIAKDFFKQAADLSKQFNFKFDGGKFDDKNKPKGEKPKFDFLFDFLSFDPNGKMKPEQKGELLNAVDKFQKEFAGLFQGALFTGTEDQRIQQAKKFDLKLKAGKVDFDVSALREAIDKSFRPEELMPPQDKLDELPKLVVDEYIRGFQNESERLKGINLFGDLTFANDLPAQIDLFKTRIKQLGAQVPGIVKATGLQGQPIEIKLEDLIDTSKISNADALDALKKAFELIKGFVVDQKDGLQRAINDTISSIEVSGFSTIGEAIGEALTGGNIGDAFKAFEQMLGDAVQGLGKQIIALNVAALAAKKALKLTFANPAIGIAAGIALVAVGTALKSLTSKGIKGFAKGGIVPGQGSGDTVPAMLTPGEFVVPKKFAKLAAMMFDGGFKLPRMNNNRLHFAEGGFVPNIERTSPIQQIKNIINPTPVQLPDYLPVVHLTYDAIRVGYQRANKAKTIFGG